MSGESELQVVDLSNPDTPISLDPIDLSAFGSGANSVAIHKGLIAVAAIEADPSANAGCVIFLLGAAEDDQILDFRGQDVMLG